MESLPDHLIAHMSQHMDAPTLAAALCVNRTFKANLELQEATTSQKILYIVRDVLFRPCSYFAKGVSSVGGSNKKNGTIQICLNDDAGHVYCWITRRAQDARPFYKLDGATYSPTFDLYRRKSDARKGAIVTEVFDRFLKRLESTITGITIYTSLKKNSKPIKALRKRFKAVFPQDDIYVFEDGGI